MNHDNVIHPSSYAQREYRDTLFQCICVYCIYEGATSFLQLWLAQLSLLQPNHNQPIHTPDTAGSHSTTPSHPSLIHPYIHTPANQSCHTVILISLISQSPPPTANSHPETPNKEQRNNSIPDRGRCACVCVWVCVWVSVCLMMPMCTYANVYVCAGECVRG